ncbi:uncharacterized protein BDV17DRAFT_230885 [Aspergillus undulatus]|uniref:uncharacterized protein n=1 Tax=Aspergillus undulatus TaxID=1810928 RepID=UPI003CCD10FF
MSSPAIHEISSPLLILIASSPLFSTWSAAALPSMSPWRAAEPVGSLNTTTLLAGLGSVEGCLSVAGFRCPRWICERIRTLLITAGTRKTNSILLVQSSRCPVE